MVSELMLEGALKIGELTDMYYVGLTDSQLSLWSIKRDKPVAIGETGCIKFLERYSLKPDKELLNISFS